MRIENLREEIKNGLKRAVATVTWEDCNRPAKDVYFETTVEYAADLTANPNAFITGCIIPAMYHGEKRVKIEGGICPQLREGLITNMEWLRLWHGLQYQIVLMEADNRISSAVSTVSKGHGLFVSGGLDSLYSLRINRMQFPLNHEASIRDGFLVYGFDMYNEEQSERKEETFNLAVSRLSEIAQEAQVNLIPVYTNLRHLTDDPRYQFWMHWFFGAALSSVGHAFASRLKSILISADGTVLDVQPRWGSHVVMDYNFGSFDLSVVHGQLRSRFEKVKVVSHWDAALNNMRVCTQNPSGLLNCGKCEKCIRTMVMLLAFGKLKDSKAFPVKDISPELLRNIVIKDKKSYLIPYYADVTPQLKRIGRYDLARVLEKELGWIGDIKRFDRKYLGNIIVKSYQPILWLKNKLCSNAKN